MGDPKSRAMLFICVTKHITHQNSTMPAFGASQTSTTIVYLELSNDPQIFQDQSLLKRQAGAGNTDVTQSSSTSYSLYIYVAIVFLLLVFCLICLPMLASRRRRSRITTAIRPMTQQEQEAEAELLRILQSLHRGLNNIVSEDVDIELRTSLSPVEEPLPAYEQGSYKPPSLSGVEGEEEGDRFVLTVPERTYSRPAAAAYDVIELPLARPAEQMPTLTPAFPEPARLGID